MAAGSREEHEAEGPLATPIGISGNSEERTPFAGLQACAAMHAPPEVGQGPALDGPNVH